MIIKNTAVAFLRVSSHRQKDNTSHDTQEQEMLNYVRENALEMVQVFRLTESAKDADKRKQYTQGLKWALKNKVRHVLFYVFDRETRNLTDNESNEKLVRAGSIVIHYVKERRIYHAESSDSDFFLRDVQAVTNKQFVRQLRTKVMDAQRTKAEQGWFPGNKPPLGYVTQKQRDSEGRELKRGTIIVRDPNEKKVRQVQREFELRAKGFSAQQIRDLIIQEGFISPLEITKYYRAAIEHRLRNKFYSGRFDWQNLEYKGNHELIIQSDILERVQGSVGKGSYQKKGPGIFGGGFLKCESCGCHVVYDPKTKVILASGERKTFHYYHCTNGKRAHASIKNVNETKLWDWFSVALDEITIDEVLAEKISNALNESYFEIKRARKLEIERYRGVLASLEAKEDGAYADMQSGLLDEVMYRRQIAKVRAERKRYTDLLEKSSEELDERALESAQSTLELAKDAKALWLSRSAEERLDFLKLILSNPRLDAECVRYDLRKPWSTLKEMNASNEWRPYLYRFLTDSAVKAV
jgi:hypothetical protein